MRQVAPIMAVFAALAATVLLASMAQGWVSDHAVALQREAQSALAGALRALRAGQPWAVASFLGVCFTHGFLHALGPGHGKAVIAAYAAASPSALRWLCGLAALSSLAQAAVAVVLVYAGVWLLDGARDRVEGLARLVEPLSFALIAALGAMLFWRGARRLGRMRITVEGWHDHHHHHHDHHGSDEVHDTACGCGHAHAPDMDAVAAARSWREAAALVLGVAMRPCTSALFLLILTWRLGLDRIGILGAFTMGLGVMMVTISAALIAALARRGVFWSLPQGRGLALTVPALEMIIGMAIVVIAGRTVLYLA